MPFARRTPLATLRAPVYAAAVTVCLWGGFMPRQAWAQGDAQTAPPASVMPTATAGQHKLAVLSPKRNLAPPRAPQGRPLPGRTARPAAPSADAVEEIETAEVLVAPVGSHAATWWGDAWPAWDRVIDAMTARTVRKHTFGTIISHRNYGGFTRKPFHSLLGFDAGSLKVGLGLRFGILDDLDIGLVRFNGTSEQFNTYELDARYNILSQKNFGVDLALRVGMSWFEQYQASDAAGVLVQLLIDRIILNRIFLGGGFLFHSSSSGPKKTSTDVNTSAAIQLYTDFRLYDGMSLAFELTQNIAGYHLKNPIFTFGPRFITNRHTFSIVMSNSQYTGADGIIAGTDRSFGNWILGFNITREL
jgi:hypothetical protein